MNAISLLRFARTFSLIVGVMDLGTGLGLLLAPDFTLHQMHVTPPSGEALAFMRFVGVFVGAVGFSYLWAIATRDPLRLRTTLLLTAFFRAGAGIYTGVAVATGTFEAAWLAVTVTDLACVGLQSWLVAKGVGRNG